MRENDRKTGESLKDFFGRKLNYVRISVTDRCNYRCRYCMPEDGVEWIPHDRIMSYEDIFFLVRVLLRLGVGKVRFTGGEPLVRKGMVPFLERICTSFPELRVAMTTNGSLLAGCARDLVRAGLSAVNISLDTLNSEKFAAMTRGGVLRDVLEGIDALFSAGARERKMSVRMNTVLVRGFNDRETETLMDFARSRGILLRFIEFMPLDGSVWSEESFVPFSEVLAGLPDASMWEAETGERSVFAGPARYYANRITGQRVGVISAVSRHFCASCNRLRVTATGEVRACLFSNRQVPILDVLRSRDEAALFERLFEAARSKPEVGMTLNRDERRSMSRIGG